LSFFPEGDIAWAAVNRHGAAQSVSELRVALAEVIRPAAPRVVAEIGCAMGGMLWLFGQLGAEVWGITDHQRGTHAHGAKMFWGDSHSPEAGEWLAQAGPLDLLHIDGDHTWEGVCSDWVMYGPLVRPGGLVLFHDVANPRDCPDVVRFWERFEIAHPGCRTIAEEADPLGIGIYVMEA
jgi:cephalosporin hydroxylase